MKIEQICILGGTGFVGWHVARRLINSGYRVKILTRFRERHRDLLVCPTARVIQADPYDRATLRAQLADCQAVINLVAILNGSEQAFNKAHVEFPRQVAEVCAEVGVQRLLHMSALNADANKGASLYLKSKGAGEQAVFAAAGNVPVTCFRPSVIFGPDDHFFNQFATLLKLGPVFPVVCPNTRFAPVYIGDVVEALLAALTNEATFGKSLDLCGPRVYTLRELVQMTAEMAGVCRLIVDMPDGLARLQAKILQRLPGQLFTEDNYRSLQVDSVCTDDGFAGLGITPKSVESIMPGYLSGRAAKSFRYSAFRRAGRS